MIPRISPSRIISNSSPSILISELLYLPNKIRLPILTSYACRVPSILYWPSPAAITSPSCGFSFALSEDDETAAHLLAFLYTLHDNSII
jgi:hypothetical protein